MDEFAEAMQAYLASNIDKFVIITLKDGKQVRGILQRIGGGLLILKTEKGEKACKVSNIEDADLPDDEPEVESILSRGNGHQKNLDVPALPINVSTVPVQVDVLPVASVEQIPSVSREKAIVQIVPTIPASLGQPEPITQIKMGVEYIAGMQPASPASDSAVLRKMLGIEVQLEVKIQNAHLVPLTPDFVRPTDLKDANQKRLWDSISNRYNNAAKIHELDPRFGRLQNILKELEELIALAPTVASVRRYYAYLLYNFVQNVEQAIKQYQEITYLVPIVPDWYNLAVLTLMQDESEQRRLAYYALGQVFKSASFLTYLDAWYTYVGLLHELNDYLPLASIYQAMVARGITAEEEQQFLEVCLYLLKCRDQEDLSLKLVHRLHVGESAQTLLREISTKYLTAPERHIHQPLHQQWEQDQYQFWERLPSAPESVSKPVASANTRVAYISSNQGSTTVVSETERRMHGTVQSFDRNRNFGYLRGKGQERYFFHRSAVVDEGLLAELQALSSQSPLVQMEVAFIVADGLRGPKALNVSRSRTIEQTFDLAVNYASDGEYGKAIMQIKVVLAQDANYPHARELLENWREFERVKGVPSGSNPYARAKRKQLLEKDLEGAIHLFREAIRKNDNTASAIKDLAAELIRANRTPEAIEMLKEHRTRANDQQSVNNLLIDAYQKVGEYTLAIDLLRTILQQIPASAVNRKAQVCGRMGICHLRAEKYKDAEYWFREVIKLGADNKGIQRNLALSLLRQGRDEDAEKLLQANLPDEASAELLDAMLKARETGQSIDIAEFSTEITLADFSGEISSFAQFFLARCTYEGVDSQNRISKQFERTDVRNLEALATRLGTRRSRERAQYYLSAAKILLEHEDWEDESNQIYKYLCRSFTSCGDAAVIENKPLDTAREWYCEALNVYDGDWGRGRRHDEQDAINAIVRFLLASVSRKDVPFQEAGSRINLKIDEGLNQVLREYRQPEKILPVIAYLVFHSKFAASRILTRLYTEPDFQSIALDYLSGQGIAVPDGSISQDQFTDLWKQLQLKDHEDTRFLAVELHTVSSRLEAVEENLGRLRVMGQKLFFDQDRRKIDELQKILEAMLDLREQITFEEKERFCTQIEKRCQDLLLEIESNPTRLSVESIYPIVTAIKEKNAEFLERTYESSVPQLILRLPKDMASFSPDANNRRFEVQVVIENQVGCSPADAIELVIQESEFFTVEMPEVKLEGSLRGGDQRIRLVPIQVTELALHEQTFIFPVYAQYHTRSGDSQQTQEKAFSINLYSVDQFEHISNPYATYANGHVVMDKHMFYGREELIRNMAETIGNRPDQSKSIVIYGQKRSGKSSILYHLKLYLQQQYENLLVVDLESIGSYLDGSSSVKLHYQLMGGILRQLRYAIEDELEQGKRNPLNIDIPKETQFYQHPTPVPYFQDILKEFKRAIAKTEGWQGVHLVLLLDEFSYLYGLIAQGRLTEDFMTNWKAILQQNLFSVVLAGQDVMPKFIARFPNEFAAIKAQRISYLEADEARKLIDEPLCIGGKLGESRYREKAIDRIMDLTAGSPFYIQIFCARLVEYMNHKHINLVTQVDVEQVKNELIRGINALDENNFDNLVSSGDTSPNAIPEKEANEVLKVIAMNNRTDFCSRDRIIVETQTDIEQILQDLLTREVIEARGRYYAIRVGLFKEWLNAH